MRGVCLHVIMGSSMFGSLWIMKSVNLKELVDTMVKTGMATLANISANLKTLQDQVDASNSNLDQLFLLIMGIFVLCKFQFCHIHWGFVAFENTGNKIMNDFW